MAETEFTKLEILLPDSCKCGVKNLKIWGQRISGALKLDVRCMSCGKPLWNLDKDTEA